MSRCQGTARDALEGGGYPPPPSPFQGPQPMSHRCLPNGKVPGSMAFVTDSNRPPTALATSSNRLSNRFWGRL